MQSMGNVGESQHGLKLEVLDSVKSWLSSPWGRKKERGRGGGGGGLVPGDACDSSLRNGRQSQHGLDNMGVLGHVPIERVQKGVLIIWPIGLRRARYTGAIHPPRKGLGTLHQASHQPP